MIDFPASPTVGQFFAASNGVTYQWNGTIWVTASAGGTGQVQAGSGTFVPNTGVDVVIVFPTVIGGNSGNWYNPANGRYTPPAGSYFIQCTNGVQAPSGGNGTWTLKPRKNGVVIPNEGASSSGSALFSIPITVGVYVDANGTDYFEFVANCGSAGMAAQGGQFTAFPLSGMQGPPGPTGISSGDVFVTNSAQMAGGLNSFVPLILNSVVTGNAGNWYSTTTGRFTPPAGRYFIKGSVGKGAATSGAVTVEVQLTKNGVQVAIGGQVPGAANWWGDPEAAALVDANGIDWFDMRTSFNNASDYILAGCASFIAFSTQVGPPGPAGPAGPVGTPPVGDFLASQNAAFSLGAGGAVLALNTVTSGNSGSYYNTTTGRYTPPAGRYQLFGMFSSAGAGGGAISLCYFRKNGVQLPNQSGSSNTPSASLTAQLFTQATVDANGTDYFEFFGYSNVATTANCNAYFGAFPLTGIAGQAGAFGTGFRTISNQTTGLQPTVDVQLLPTDVNQLEINFDITPVTNDVDLFLQFYDASGVLDATAAHYVWMNNMAWSTAGGAAASQITNSTSTGITGAIAMNYSAAGGKPGNQAGNSISGRITIPNIRDTTKTKKVTNGGTYFSSNSSYLVTFAGGGYRNVAGLITGFRLSFGSGNIAAGGNVTVWGSP